MLRVIEGGLPPRKHVILVVDDEILIRMALADHLENAGYSVVEAANAHQAIALLLEPDSKVDLVFTDVRMPGQMDGLGLSRWIIENRPNIPVVIASGEVGKTIAVEDLCGAVVMPKPYSYEIVAAKIRETIQGKRRPIV